MSNDIAICDINHVYFFVISIDYDYYDDTGAEMSQEIVGRFVWPPKDVVIGTMLYRLIYYAFIYIHIYI